MELLSQITRQIDFLKTNPGEIDVDETCRILAVAHEVGRDGLKRSQNAELYLQVQPRYEQLQAAHEELTADHAKQAKALGEAVQELEAFATVLEELRNETAGRVALIAMYGEKRRSDLQEKLKTAGIETILGMRKTVRDDFNAEWNGKAGTAEVLAPAGPFKDPKLYKTGA